ncbi:MAG: sigma-70 family RNA polymerase sigma factor [Anaeromyxobacteraceae bacterium]
MKSRGSAADVLAQGDIQGGVALVMRDLGPRVYGLLMSLLRNREETAEEAFSLFAENLCRYAATYRGEGSLEAWVYTLARNAAVTVTRDGWRMRGRRLATRESEKLAEDVRTRSALRRERQANVLDELRATLDLDEQILLALRLDEALSWEDVARVMSGDGPAVDAQVVRKRFERLKGRLGDEARRLGYLG